VPLVAIDVLEGRSQQDLDAICDCVQVAMRETLEVPEHDRFQIVTEHSPQTLRFDREYLQGDRSDGFVLIRVTLAAGRSVEVKRSFYARVVELLAAGATVQAEDVMVVLVENGREDWSFGRGQASYVEIPKEEWR
jgi:4-oxalocrotonate tautomerase